MRPSFFLSLPFVLAVAVGCGGTFVVAPGDAGSDGPQGDDSSPPDAIVSDSTPPPPIDGEPPPIICNNQPCGRNMYCIHLTGTMCPTCVSTDDAGACPPGSHQGFCGGPPIFDAGNQCVIDPPSPPAPYCSTTIPPECQAPLVMGFDVECGPIVCAQGK